MNLAIQQVIIGLGCYMLVEIWGNATWEMDLTYCKKRLNITQSLKIQRKFEALRSLTENNLVLLTVLQDLRHTCEEIGVQGQSDT